MRTAIAIVALLLMSAAMGAWPNFNAPPKPPQSGLNIPPPPTDDPGLGPAVTNVYTPADALARLHREFKDVRFAAWRAEKWVHGEEIRDVELAPVDIDVTFEKACIYEALVRDDLCVILWYRLTPPEGQEFPEVFRTRAVSPKGWVPGNVKVYPTTFTDGPISWSVGSLEQDCIPQEIGVEFGNSYIAHDHIDVGEEWPKEVNPRREVRPFEVDTQDGTFFVGLLMARCEKEGDE